MATRTITISRETRDLLHKNLDYELERYIGTGDGSEHVRTVLGRMLWVCDLLDVLGWGEDDDRAVYEVPADDSLTEWLRWLLADINESVEGDRSGLAELEAGDDERCYLGHSVSESLVMRHAYIARQEREAELLSRLLDELGATVGAVA